MSIIDNSKGGVNPSKGKDLAKSSLESSKVTDKIKAVASEKLNSVTAPVQEAVNKTKDKINEVQAGIGKAKNIMASTPGISSAVGGGYSNFKVTPSEVLEKESLLSKAMSYGGNLTKLFGDSHLVSCTVQINGEEVLTESNYQLSISQKTAEHDEFKLSCPADAFGEASAYPLSQTGNFLGKRMTALFRQFGVVASSFTGIITNISSRKQDGFSFITLTGNSPTILLENGMDSQSYEQKSLKDIIAGATSEYAGLLEWDIRPQMEDKILYTVQYKESDWDFIKRLAVRYGEWIYWDGQKVVFGGFGGKTVELQESLDISRFELKMKLVPQKFTYLGYDAKKAKNYNVDSESIAIEPSVNPFQQTAVKASQEVFSKVPASLYNQTLMEKGEQELKDAVKRQKQNRQNVFFLEADSDNPELRIGDIVKLKAYMPGNKIFKKGDVPLESYRILNIKHEYDPALGYKNTFTAIPKDNFTPPYMNEDAVPKCEEQSAIVMDNNDPEGLSRIRVQFPWQKIKGGQTPWIRSITPYAGKGKGMHVVPEIGEEVIVSFENGNAEKPVSLGAMFNGSGKSGHGGSGNYMKGLQTASGSNLTFNDQAGSMNLADKGGASMKFDGAGNATSNAKQTHAVNAGAASNTSVGEDASTLKMDAGGNITLEGKTNITLKVGGSTIVITENEINVNGQTVKVIGERAEVGHAEASEGMLVNQSGDTYINGNKIITKSSGPTQISGADVEINKG